MPIVRLLISLLLIILVSINAQATSLLLDGGGYNFGPGDQLNLSVGIIHNDSSVNVDTYLALLDPGGNVLFLSLGANGVEIHPGGLDASSWTPFLSNLSLASGTNTGQVSIFSYAFSGVESLGDYQWLLGATPSGQQDFLALSSYSFRVGSRPLAELLGDWQGDWTNTTFSSTGAASLKIEQGDAPGLLKMTIDLDGFVGGMLDPDPETVTVSINNDGTLGYSGSIPLLGQTTANIATNGEVTINVPDIETMGFDTFEASGLIVNNIIDLDYTVTFTGGGSASGTVIGSKE